jgi:hypothetical protein
MMPKPLYMILAIHMWFGCAFLHGQDSPDIGQVVLHAIDADTHKPVPDVVFYKFNSLAEDWFVELGTTDDSGQLSFKSSRTPGYYFSISRVPTGYKVASIDDVASGVIPGKTVHHHFQLRQIPAADSFPKVVDVPPDEPSRIPRPTQLVGNVHLQSVVEHMPGFPNQRLKFWFHPNERGEVTAEQLRLSERIFHNGARILAAVKDELTYLQKAETHDKGDIEKMEDILIEIDGARKWCFWCRLSNGMRLRQHGYRIAFDDVSSWDLEIPDYLQPDFND